MANKHKISFFSLKNIIIAILIVSLSISLYYSYQTYSKVDPLNNRISQLESEKNSLQSQIDNLNAEITDLNFEIQTKDSTIESQKTEISNLKYDIEQKKKEIKRLENKVNELEEELGITKTQLEETTELYEGAKPYQERVERGQNLGKYYTLLGDNQDYAKPIILESLDLSTPTAPSNDNELWERGRKIYNWIANNYKYCGDKGLRVGTTFYEFQFYSPDELLMSDNVRCGDCDDFATLFAGLMYASGVPEDEVWVVCGVVEGFLSEGGGHCWNELVLEDKTYRIDPTCSDGTGAISILGFDFGLRSAFYLPYIKTNVQCAKTYTSQARMNPKGFYLIE